MTGVLVATKMLKDAGIVTIACLSSKTTGGTFVNVYGNDIIFSEKASNLLFAGARVSASVNAGNELPADFGYSSSLEQHGMIDGEVGTLEFKSKISSLVKVMLKKAEKSNTSSSNVTIDQSILQQTSKAL